MGLEEIPVLGGSLKWKDKDKEKKKSKRGP